jgi:putative tryptophan/tyrosine transport system substrate-binding protein
MGSWLLGFRMQFDQLRRREFITLLCGAVAFRPLAASAQAPGRTYRLGGLIPTPRGAPQNVALFEELRRSGFIEGQNLTIHWHPYGQRVELVSEFATDLVKARVDVIVAGGNFGIRAAQQATATIPIIGFTDDMLGSRLVNSLARPGGNTTGISLLATELDGRRLEILIEAAPGLRNMAALADTGTTSARQLQALQDAARTRGVELSIHQVASAEEIAPAIDAAKASKAAALNILASPLLNASRKVVIERAATLRLPAIYQWPEAAEEGGLIGYGPRLVLLWRDLLARQLVKILRGAKPADLPVEQPTNFELVINLQAAKAIGHEVPAGLVLRADKVIE